MKNYVWLLSIAIVLAVGCDKKSVYIDDKGNQVNVAADGKSVDVKTADGDAKMKFDESGNFEIQGPDGKVAAGGVGMVSEAQLGVPFYPDSKELAGSMSMQTDEGENVVSVRETSDSPDKVKAFYESKLGKPTGTVVSGDSFFGNWDSGGRVTTVMVTKAEKSTTITITNLRKKK